MTNEQSSTTTTTTTSSAGTDTITISGRTVPTSAEQLPISSESKESLSFKASLAQYLIRADKLRISTEGSKEGTAGTAGTSGSYGVSNPIWNEDTDKIFSEYMGYKEGEGDAIFEKYGPGNPLSSEDRPFERAKAYEEFLIILHDYDKNQFLKIHKGTPYYFIGWTTFQFTDYSKALFYMDAALSDDLRFPEIADQSQTRPAIDFFLLKDSSPGSGFSMHQKLNEVFDSRLNDFNLRSGLSVLKTDFVEKFIKPLLYADAKKRSLLTALYTFLLNYEKRTAEIKLRSKTGGSINVFVDELFDGARLLESLLEVAGGTGSVLRTKIQSLSILLVSNTSLIGNQSLIDAELHFNNLKGHGANFQDCVYCASYIIRNTTGHSLLWDDQFVNERSYATLYDCLIDSIFWAAYKCWIE